MATKTDEEKRRPLGTRFHCPVTLRATVLVMLTTRQVRSCSRVTMSPSSKLSSDPFVSGKKSSLCLLLLYTLAHVTILPISLLIRNSLRLLLEDSHIFKTTEYAQDRNWCARIGRVNADGRGTDRRRQSQRLLASRGLQRGSLRRGAAIVLGERGPLHAV